MESNENPYHSGSTVAEPVALTEENVADPMARSMILGMTLVGGVAVVHTAIACLLEANGVSADQFFEEHRFASNVANGTAGVVAFTSLISGFVQTLMRMKKWRGYIIPPKS